MNRSITTSLVILSLILFGAAQAHEPSGASTDKKVMEMEMPMMKNHMANKSDHKAEPEAQRNQVKHDHRKFKGLPSASAGAKSDEVDSDKPEAHDHRKQHK